MNFNANTGGRPPFGRKIKRLSDVNSMGYSPAGNAPAQQNFSPQQNFAQQQQQPPYNYNAAPYPSIDTGSNISMNQMTPVPAPTIMQDMALQYGQQLAGAGTAALKSEVEKLVPISKLKYYFAVDTKYVMTKLMLLFFPFKHQDWSVKYEQPLQPRYEINALDLYIPMMAYITYVVVAGMVLGTQQRFSPEQLSTLASSALAWCIAELAVYSCNLYIIGSNWSTLDLVACSGYKFVGIIVSTLVSLAAESTGYYVSLVYMNIALAFFLVRTLRVHVMGDSSQQNDYYGSQTGYKRRSYFLLVAAGIQPVLSWWLSYHLLPPALTKTVDTGPNFVN